MICLKYVVGLNAEFEYKNLLSIVRELLCPIWHGKFIGTVKTDFYS
jgi:hypothetical protein